MRGWKNSSRNCARDRRKSRLCREQKILETSSASKFIRARWPSAKFPPQPLETFLTASPRPLLFAAAGGHCPTRKTSARLVRNCAAFGVHVADRGRDVRQPVPAPRRSQFHGRHLSSCRCCEPDDPRANLDANCARAACAVSRRIRTRTKKFCRSRISAATAAWFLAAKARAFHGAVLAACDEAVAIPMPNDSGFAERRRRHGGVPLRSQPATKEKLICHRDTEAQRKFQTRIF